MNPQCTLYLYVRQGSKKVVHGKWEWGRLTKLRFYESCYFVFTSGYCWSPDGRAHSFKSCPLVFMRKF